MENGREKEGIWVYEQLTAHKAAQCESSTREGDSP